MFECFDKDWQLILGSRKSQISYQIEFRINIWNFKNQIEYSIMDISRKINNHVSPFNQVDETISNSLMKIRTKTYNTLDKVSEINIQVW